MLRGHDLVGPSHVIDARHLVLTSALVVAAGCAHHPARSTVALFPPPAGFVPGSSSSVAPEWTHHPAVSGFSVRYNPTRNPVHARQLATLEHDRVFEQVATALNRMVRLPAPVEIQTYDCGAVNAFYDERTRRVTICYELIDDFVDAFKNAGDSGQALANAVIGATLFTAYHEAAHGLIHVLELPAVGHEEDSADQLATLALMSTGDVGVARALDGARWFQLQASQEHDTPLWDEHAIDAQRYYSVVCLIYGANPVKYGWFIGRGMLPAERASRCPEEYAKISRSWQTLLAPYVARR